MPLFDAHCHLQDQRIFPDAELFLQRAKEAGVEKMAVKGCAESDWSRVIQLQKKHPDRLYMAFGLHPWFIKERSIHWLECLEEKLLEYPDASVGEIGIDHAFAGRNDADQEKVFLAQMKLAVRLNRPVTIHCRQAWGRLIKLLDQLEMLPPLLIHCFGGSVETAQELLRRGAFISFSGTITRPENKKARGVIRSIPANRLLLETDAPDLLPHNLPFSSSPTINQPAYLPFILAHAAVLRGESEEYLKKITFQNASQFFTP